MQKFIIAATLLTLGCASTPTARKLVLEVDWVRSLPQNSYYGFRHAERTNPILDGDMIYQGNAIDGVSAYYKNTGSLKWHYFVKNGVESGITLDQDKLFFGGSDGQFYCISKITGKAVWTFPTRVENLSPSAFVNGVIYFLSGNNVVYALDSKTGKQLWNYNRGDVSSLSIRGGTKPFIYKNTIYVGFSDGFLVAINALDGSMIWERKISTNPKFVDVDASPVADENFIWVSSYDGALFGLSRSDGQIQWRLDEGGSVPVTVSGDTLYFASLNQNVYALNKTTGKEKWRFNFKENKGIPTQPVLFKGMVVVGSSEGPLMILSGLNGKLVAQYSPGTGVFSTPAVDEADSKLYFLSNQSNLYSLKLNWMRPGEM